MIKRTRYLKAAIVLFGFCCLLQMAGCSREEGKGKADQPNVILIVVDTLRPDHLGCYGYPRNTSPRIDELAATSTRFKTAVTVCPRTTPSAASILSGLYPHSHGIRFYGDRASNPGVTSLAEILRDRGYLTAAFMHQGGVLYNPALRRGFQIGKNFQNDDWVIAAASSWLEEVRASGRPVFLLVWLLAPHAPYEPPERDLELFLPGGRDILDKLLLKQSGEHLEGLRRDKGGEVSTAYQAIFSEEEVETLVRAYDGEIHRSDRNVGILIDSLKELGIFADSLVIFVADHGESLGEHDYYFEHGDYLYDPEALIPLIIKRPGQVAGDVFEYQVRSIDIFPTILSVVGVEHGSEGRNLFPRRGEDSESLKNMLAFGESGLSWHPENKRRYIAGTAGKWRTVRSDRRKLIFIPHPEKEIYEFYDLDNDPGETVNLINDDRYQSEIADFKRELWNWMRPDDFTPGEADVPVQINQEQRRLLKSLGYLK